MAVSYKEPQRFIGRKYSVADSSKRRTPSRYKSIFDALTLRRGRDKLISVGRGSNEADLRKKSYICVTIVVIMKNYPLEDENTDSVANEPSVGYLIGFSQNGMPYQLFENQTSSIPFNQGEWSDLLHLSERTFQRYKKENKRLESIYTEKILEIILLFRRGTEVFGSTKAFYEWLVTPNVSLGDKKPYTIIDNTFGIQLVTDTLGRIEHGVFS